MTRVRQATATLLSRGRIQQCTPSLRCTTVFDHSQGCSTGSTIPSFPINGFVNRNLHTRWSPSCFGTLINDARMTAFTPCSVTVRGLAIKRKRGAGRAQRKNQNQEDLPLMNEHLVKKIMDQSYASSPATVKMRLVVEQGHGTPPTSMETTLADAIKTSVDLGLDLVEINLDSHELPVVRAVHFEAKLYRANKEKAAKAKSNKDLDVKEFRFRAKTADHDFDRKLARVTEALEKGHKCKIMATCPSRFVLNNQLPLGAGAVIERVVTEIASTGETLNPPDVNKEKTHATVMLIPQKKKKK